MDHIQPSPRQRKQNTNDQIEAPFWHCPWCAKQKSWLTLPEDHVLYCGGSLDAMQTAYREAGPGITTN